MPGLPAPADLGRERRKPRYYVLRVVSCERNFTPVHVAVTAGPYPTLIDAWRRVEIVRQEFEGEIFVAGEMDSAVQPRIQRENAA
jgi:hypothetical protein